jgi:hypothetical protein
MLTLTGTDRESEGVRLAGLVVPAADAVGCGACTCEAIARPIADRPPRTRAVPSSPATRARGVGDGGGGGGPPEIEFSGQDMTTRSPPTRRHLVLPNASSSRTLWLHLASYSLLATAPAGYTPLAAPGAAFGAVGPAMSRYRPFRTKLYSRSLISKWKTRHCEMCLYLNRRRDLTPPPAGYTRRSDEGEQG